jgi:rSAM/selenodomain-associated transferase 1
MDRARAMDREGEGSGDVLVVFLKWPEPGRVKTRLAAALGPERAAELYRLVAEEEVRRTRPVARAYDRLLFFAPAEARARIAAWFPQEELLPQAGRDLGARMADAFAQAFRRGARRVAIVGTDVPQVSAETVAAGFESLVTHDVALGPARDGGYYLLGLRAPQPELFTGIGWSTPGVRAATLERATRLGLSVRCLETMTDLDTLQDVRSEWPRLEPLLARHPALRKAVRDALESPGPLV